MVLEFINNLAIENYLKSLIYFFVYFIVIGVVAFALKKIILKIALRTKTDFDDLLIQRLNKPIFILIFFTGLKYAIEKVFSVENISTLSEIFNSFILLGAVYLIYIIFDLSFSRAWREFAKKAKIKPNEALMQLTSIALRVILILLGFIYILNLWGIEIGPILAGAGIGGIAIAFALQKSLGDIFGGISIILDKSIKVGDVVTLKEGISGKITQIGLRSTKITTWDNEFLIVPNSKLSESIIHNITMPEPRSRTVIPFSVAYGSDIKKVKKIVLNEIKKIKGFTNEPEPVVRFLEMADSSLKFKVYFFVESYTLRFEAIDEANTKIYDALNKAGIEIPFSQLDIHMKN